MIIEENAPLAALTTFRLGGPARFFARASTLGDLQEAFAFAKRKSLRTLILGGGSNMLIAEVGFDGLVIKLEMLGVRREGDMLIAGAGESWDSLVARAVEERLWGIENLSGIPGTVGGAVVQGIGAYGAAVGETLEWAEVLDSESNELKKMTKEECAFEYRDSYFKHDNGRHVVVRAAFALSRQPRPELSYKDLSPLRGTEVTLAQVRDAVLLIRKDKFPDITQEGTAGSFFKNLILPKAAAEALKHDYPDMPLFDLPESAGVKVPLAWLLDRVLHLNGVREGGARFFERQPLVIVADFGSSARDVLALAQTAKEAVKNNFNFEIEEEVRIIS